MLDLLQAFGEAVQQPLRQDYGSQLPPAPYLTRSPKLQPEQRLAIYNQQYWIRFFKLMESSFPMVARLFGSQPFHHLLVTPYVQAHPPTHWSIDQMGEHFVQWLERTYSGEDKPLVVLAVQLDWAICEGPLLPQLPPASVEQAASQPLRLQPHVSLWQMPWPLPPLRQRLLERSVDGWLNDPFPHLEREECWWLLGRNREGVMVWRRLTCAQWQLLKQLESGATLQQALEALPDSELDEASHGISAWFLEWAHQGWLT
jgi:hypothetical protein